jgi:riboflavin synthase
MFTGIIQSTGKIDSFERGPIGQGRTGLETNTARLRVRFGPDLIAAAPLAIGASIAVNGCCLTVVECGADFFVADLSPETLARTAFGEKRPGDCVSLERPLTLGAELGGHMVQGHVDGVGRVQSVSSDGPEGSDNNAWWLAVSVPAEIANYVVEKGSLTVDGISLTVARWADGSAGIAVIPFTYQHTNVRHLSAGDAVNLECDVMAKYVERFADNVQRERLLAPHPKTALSKAAPSKITIERLAREGF